VTWNEFADWLQKPEQKKLWPNTPLDKKRNYCGPDYKLLNFNYGYGIRWLNDTPYFLGETPLRPELAFMHEAVVMDGQLNADIELPYEGCDYDYRDGMGDYECEPTDRVTRYLNESNPLPEQKN